MKAVATTAVVGALLTLVADASPTVKDREVDEKYPYKGPDVPIGDWVDNSVNGNGKGFKRLVLPPAVKPASSKVTNNINVVSLSYFPGGINIHYQTPFGLGAEPAVRWGTSPDSLENIATGHTHSYDRTPPCSVARPITQCSQFFHDVRIGDLEAGSTYYYQIPGANGTTQSDVLSFTTARAAGDERPYSISVLNDMGYTNADETYVQLKKLVDEGSQFVVHGGDISYADDWNQGILACDESDEASVCYNGSDSRLPGEAPTPQEYLHPLPEGEKPNQGSPRGGDMSPVYETNWDAWQQWISYVSTRVPYMVLPGNHEVSCGHHEDASNVTTAYLNFNATNATAPEENLNYYSCPPSQRNFTAYQHRFTMPGDAMGGVGNFWYSFDYGLVHFVFVDTETDYPNPAESDFAHDVDDLDYEQPRPKDTSSNDGGPFGAVSGNIGDNDSYEQLRWVAEDLAAVDREATPWVVVMGHRPMYSSQVSDYQESIRNAFQSTFLEHGVDMYISGHIHWYERLLPLTGNGGIDTASVRDNNTYYANPGKSLTHIINGAAGNVQSHSILGDDPRLNISQVLDQYHYGLINMTVHNETALSVSYIFADDGSVGDELTVIKKSE